MNELICEHEWTFQESVYIKSEYGRYNYNYKKIDIYYCKKCLKTKEIIRKEDERYYLENPPCWFKE